MAEFKDRFRQLRNEKDMSQEVLANDFNSKFHYSFGKSSISMYENGKRTPEINALEDFATYFGVSVDFLLGRVDVREPYDKNTDKPNDNNDKPIDKSSTMAKYGNYDDLSPESQRELERYMELLKIKEQMDKSKDETSSALEKDA